MLTEVSGSMGLVSNILHFRAIRNMCWKAEGKLGRRSGPVEVSKSILLRKSMHVPWEEGLVGHRKGARSPVPLSEGTWYLNKLWELSICSEAALLGWPCCLGAGHQSPIQLFIMISQNWEKLERQPR